MNNLTVAALTLCALLVPGTAARASDQAPLSAGAYILSAGKLKAGDRVPAFRAKDIYGVDVSFEDLIASGRKPLLAFWSMYCQACTEKFKAMVTVQARFADRGIAVISINTDGEYRRGAQEIRDFIARYEREHGFKVNFPVLYDERNWLPAAMGIEFLPTIVTVDPQHRVAGFYQKFGETTEEAILSGIESLARELLAIPPGKDPAPAGGASTPSDRK